MRLRASSDITAPHPALLVASPARLSQSRHRRRRASAEPRASRRADRAPPTSSCVRRSRRRHAHAHSPCRVRRVSSDLTAPLALHRRLGSVRADTGDARRASAEPRASRRADRRRRPRRACADRTVDTRAPTRRVVCAVCRVTSPRLILLSSSHRRLGSLRADTGDAERAPSRERVVLLTERRRPRQACDETTLPADTSAPEDTQHDAVVQPGASAPTRAQPPSLLVASPARLCQSRHRRRPPSERRAASESSCRPSADDLVVRAPIAPSTRARRRVVCAVCRVTSPRLLRCIAGSALSEPTPMTPAERAPSRERVVVPTEHRRPRRACFAERAPIVIRASRVQPQLPRRARRRPPSSSACCCSSRHRAGSIRANTTTARAPPSRERVVVPDRAAGFAERAPIVVRASRVQPQPPRRARRRPPSSSACCCSSRHRAGSIRANTTTARAPPSRERVVVPDRAAGFAERAPIVVRASRVQPQPPRRARRRPPLELSLLLLLTSPRRLNQSQHDDRESAAEPRASRRS